MSPATWVTRFSSSRHGGRWSSGAMGHNENDQLERRDDLTTHSESETAAAGRRLGAALSGGETVLLFGDLGAGKTAFVRGLAEGLGIDSNAVTSPTFTLVQEYRCGRLPLVHVDP